MRSERPSQAGDLARAQKSFATLAAGQINPASASQTTPATVVSLAGSQPVTSPPVFNNNNSSIYQQLQAYRQQRAADLAQLGQDLQAGDLKAAQQDFNTLTALGQTGPNKNGQTFQQANRAQSFQAIGQALQSGDLAGAQSAFASLQGTFGQQSQQAQTAISAYRSASPRLSSTSGAHQCCEHQCCDHQHRKRAFDSAIQQHNFNCVHRSRDRHQPGYCVQHQRCEWINHTGTRYQPRSGRQFFAGLSQKVTIDFSSSTSGAQVSIDATQGQTGSAADQITIDLNQQIQGLRTHSEPVQSQCDEPDSEQFRRRPQFERVVPRPSSH